MVKYVHIPNAQTSPLATEHRPTLHNISSLCMIVLRQPCLYTVIPLHAVKQTLHQYKQHLRRSPLAFFMSCNKKTVKTSYKTSLTNHLHICPCSSVITDCCCRVPAKNETALSKCYKNCTLLVSKR